MQTNQTSLACERTQRIVAIIDLMEPLLSDERDRRNRLADKMVQNQKLKTSEERHADGFSIIYGDLQSAKYAVEKLEISRASLLALLH